MASLNPFAPADLEAWRKLAEKALGGGKLEKLTRRTLEGVLVEALYTSEDPARLARRVPGRLEPGPARIARHELASVTATVEAIREDVDGGADTIELVLAGSSWLGQGLPRGIVLEGEQDLDALLHACDEGESPPAISFEVGSATPRLVSELDRALERSERSLRSERFDLNLDPFGAVLVEGRSADRLAAQLATFEALVPLRTIGRTTRIDASVVFDAGATDADELAYALAGTVEYARLANSAGVEPGEHSARHGVRLAADTDVLMTLAKLRAARTCLSRIYEVLGVADQTALTVIPSARMLAQRDVWVNSLRVTLAAFAAIVGGADGLVARPHTDRSGAPSRSSRRLARNVQHVLEKEGALSAVLDAAGGSHAIEALTRDLADAAWTRFRAIERAGGLRVVIGKGELQATIAATAQQRAALVATRRMPLTGVSEFPDLREGAIDVASPWPAPLAPRPGALEVAPLAAPFERLRDRADQLAPRPAIFVATLGTAADFVARSTWVKSFFEAGGIEARSALSSEGVTRGLETAEEAASAFTTSGAAMAVLCSSDALYGSIGVEVARALREAGATRVFVAGRDPVEGADAQVHVGVDLVATLDAALAIFEGGRDG